MEQLTELLRELANQLGTTSDHIITIMMKQARVVIAQNFIWVGAMIAYFTQSLKINAWLIQKQNDRAENKSYMDENFWGFGIGAHWIIVLILAICTICTITQLVTLIFNPEYWVVDKILSGLSGLAN